MSGWTTWNAGVTAKLGSGDPAADAAAAATLAAAEEPPPPLAAEAPLPAAVAVVVPVPAVVLLPPAETATHHTIVQLNLSSVHHQAVGTLDHASKCRKMGSAPAEIPAVIAATPYKLSQPLTCLREGRGNAAAEQRHDHRDGLEC